MITVFSEKMEEQEVQVSVSAKKCFHFERFLTLPVNGRVGWGVSRQFRNHRLVLAMLSLTIPVLSVVIFLYIYFMISIECVA